MDGQEPNGAAVLDQAVLLNVLSDGRLSGGRVRREPFAEDDQQPGNVDRLVVLG